MLPAPWKDRWEDRTCALQYITTKLVLLGLSSVKNNPLKINTKNLHSHCLRINIYTITSPQNPQVEKELTHQCKTAVGNLEFKGNPETAKTWLPERERGTLSSTQVIQNSHRWSPAENELPISNYKLTRKSSTMRKHQIIEYSKLKG